MVKVHCTFSGDINYVMSIILKSTSRGQGRGGDESSEGSLSAKLRVDAQKHRVRPKPRVRKHNILTPFRIIWVMVNDATCNERSCNYQGRPDHFAYFDGSKRFCSNVWGDGQESAEGTKAQETEQKA